ncbi:nitroreductase family protein [Goodfellowiella coeruleoviolacea]|uniref:Nitroreductase n=1 Tax=Goodfellowiella coeruleoviolacea TaxID=334858 RepID=A0AAE3GB80_9PSEU|nr:nitroreductase family protein [Goodfellowiella coeruleoviolacea]MCP2164935.1 Nitroreductase [Goodfellowiella coeruleoviolacea]
MSLNLSADEVLSTTRAVRKRLDLTRPVPRELIEECVDLATQAPTGRNRQRWHFLVVTDAAQRAAVADIFRRAVQLAEGSPLTANDLRRMNAHPESLRRIFDGVQHLYATIHRVPAIVVPAVEGRTDGAPVEQQAGTWGSILPAVWSFMLAARERGLGTVWTTAQAPLERELAGVLGVPHDEVMLAALIPLAFTLGTDFRPARRVSRAEVLHWDRW